MFLAFHIARHNRELMHLCCQKKTGKRRIPIIVGGFEAQSIAIELEGLAPPRPLTHDLFKTFAYSYGIKIIEVNIHKLEEGVFFANILCDNGDSRLMLDARTSDAIALALRFKCPIYTTEEIIEKAGIVLDFEKGSALESESGQGTSKSRTGSSRKKSPGASMHLSDLSLDDLKKMLSDAVAKEDYEKASELRDEIKRRSEN